ncbi:MAG TPA: glycosyltransferase family 4 protein [Steroidobacteraceae bacterium]
MKVLMTADAVGGVWTYALELSAALARHDVEVLLATMGPLPTAMQRERAREIPNLRLECSQYKLEWMREPWDDVDRAGHWLQELADRQGADIVHLNGYSHAALDWSKPVLTVAHSCVYSWWRAVHRADPPQEWSTYRARVTEGLNRADRIVAPTQAFLDDLCRLYRPTTATAVIHNARSPSFCLRTQPHKRLPAIFACGRLWDEAKSIRILDSAVRGLPWHAYVAGDVIAPDGKYVRVSALRCLGALSQRDLAAWLKRAAIFVHPARYEPFGLAVLEAALAGCALVLSDLPTLRELWSGAAIFVNANDAAAVKRALNGLISDPERLRYLSEAARSRAYRYTPEVMADAYVALYRDLIATSRRGERAVA